MKKKLNTIKKRKKITTESRGNEAFMKLQSLLTSLLTLNMQKHNARNAIH